MEMHSWPELEKQALTVPRTARPTGASARTMSGFFPPSSADTGMRRAPAREATAEPVAVEPVNMTASTASMSGAPRAEPGPVTTWKRSGSAPARVRRRRTARAVNGVSESGLSTTALPAMSAATASDAARVRG